MLQIHCDPSTLSTAQREALAGFILTYPTATGEGLTIVPKPAPCGVAAEASPIVPEVPEASIPEPPAPPAPAPEPASPEAAFGAATPTNPVELDSAGLPWDHRIHSESRNKIADGTWRKKRGVDPALVARVEAELQAVMGVDVPEPAPTPAAAIPPPPPPPPAAATPAPADDTASLNAYIALVGKISEARAAKKLTPEQAAECCNAEGIPSIPMLANRLDLVPKVAARIDALLGGA